MQITPLVIHAGLVIPQYTTRFSDSLPVASIAVVAGGDITITCTSAHGVPVGRQKAISITDADTPNPVTAATVNGVGDIVITTQYDHDLTTSPNPDRFRVWNETVKLTGFTNALINGTRQLISVNSANSFTVRPGGAVSSVELNDGEKLLERLDGEVIGWHAATATSSTVLTIPTPAGVARSYTVANPSVVTNIRAYAAIGLNQALAHFSPENGYSLGQAHLFITPPGPIRASRSGNARGDGLGEMSPGQDFSQMLLDGFVVNVMIPGAETAAHVRAMDLCHGEIFKAIMRTFYGLKINRPELATDSPMAAVFDNHVGGTSEDRAIYIHQYEFQSPAYLSNQDAISPWLWPSVDVAGYAAAQGTLADGGVLPDNLTSVPPVGTTSFRGLDLTGILHDGMPQPLTASINTGY